MMRRFVPAIRAALTLTAILLASPAWATIDNLKTYKLAYPGKAPKAYSCKVCHQGAMGKKGDLNAYGVALQKLKAPADAKHLTIEEFRASESQDADGDRVSNGDELKAGTDPSDPASKPAGTTPATHTPPVAPQPPAQPDASSKRPGSSRLAPDDTSQLRAYLDRLIGPEAQAAQPEDARSTANDAPASEDKPPHAEYVGVETCATCHAKEYREFQQSTHARIAIPGEGMGAQGCEMCHGPGSLHVAAGGGRGVGGIINPRKDPSACFACHLDKNAEFRLPYHHPVLEGKMSCADCHSPHGAEVRPWSATTLQDINEACFKCHKEQRGPFAWEHEALREGCTTCHKVHGSIHDKMLLLRDSNLCLRCHTQTNFPTIGGSSHAGRLPQGTCFSAGCHTAVHGSNFDDHLRY